MTDFIEIAETFVMTAQWYIVIEGYVSLLFGIVMMHEMQKVTNGGKTSLTVSTSIKIACY